MAKLKSLALLRSWCLPSALAVMRLCSGTVAMGELPQTVEFNRDIQPILSDNCYQCHGPDKEQRQSDLRLDTQAGAFADLGGYRAIVSGNPEKSALFQRIASDDQAERMPPTDSGKQLSPRQIALVRRWIEQGAHWQKHWSFIPPQRHSLPQVANAHWPRTAIDSFILARLEREGLAPSPEADKVTLIRRVTLDLTGLPPTPSEVDTFLADESPDAYETVVERLLKSPRYGERMATRWLDAARYADTSGYQNDGPRTMWRWRDWVIDALNSNMPFDQFTIEQLAGDMLPNATVPQRIATGFNRNHRGNSEGGIIPEEYAVEYVVDRVDTTATVWLGLTMGCSRCHDHKYDPITQKEFYGVFAYFNNVPEFGRTIREGNSPPFIKSPTVEQQLELSKLEAKLAVANRHFKKLQPRLDAAQAKWEKSLATTPSIEWAPTDGLTAHYPLDGDAAGAATDGRFEDGPPIYAPGQLGRAGDFDGRRFVNAGDVGKFNYFDKFTCGAWIHLKDQHGGTVLSCMIDAPRANGYYVQLVDRKIQVNMVRRWLDDAIRVETEQRLAPGRWYHVMVAYDGSRVARGIKIYVNGKEQTLNIHLDAINKSFSSTEPFRIGAGGGVGSRFRGYIDDVRIYNRDLSAKEVESVATIDSITDIVVTPADQRSKSQSNKLRAYYLVNAAPKPVQQAYQQVVRLRREKRQRIESIPTTMVMQEMQEPRSTYVLTRGEYNKPGEKVTPGVPAALPPLRNGAENNRLAFAQWLMDPANPLTARVIANRYWQTFFGTGLVKTMEDFGTQGERPSHPDLLDWLATEFVHTGWDVKALHKIIVTSATYRQSSQKTPQLLKRDSDNRLLSRATRSRLTAEMIRDQALAVSGLLVERIGGPSVKPYQPAGLWKELSSGDPYEQDKGENLYRRSLYTYRKRTVAPPSMIAFDASTRETCTVRETRTNTPLQALTLMNDVTFVEASCALAERMMTEGGATPNERIVFAFRLATSRRPHPVEQTILLNGFRQHLEQYHGDPDAAQKLTSAGESVRSAEIDVVELAAYMATASLILNLDEAITKE